MRAPMLPLGRHQRTGAFRIPELPSAPTKSPLRRKDSSPRCRRRRAGRRRDPANFKLTIGQRTETVEVEGTAPMVELSPNNNNYVDSEKIENVPLNGRDFNSLLAITPGVQRPPVADSWRSASTARGTSPTITSSTACITTTATTATRPSARPASWAFPRSYSLPKRSRN